MPIRNSIAAMQEEIAGWRRELHQHPELMFDTGKTARFVADKLREFGVDEVHEGIAKNGVVAVIRGRSSASGRTIGLRADMDALPIEEATGKPWASKVPGKMHACGHDGHTAMLLGAAKHLADTRDFDGTVVLLFQPAEEGGGGGAVMVEEGVMERFGIDEVYGMHNMPGLPVGRFAIREGAFFASADQFTIVIRGKGGHAAMPHKVVDPIVAASHVVMALQTIASRAVDPIEQVVVSVTTFHSEGDSHNVIPPAVTLKGTVRTLDEAVRDLAEERLREIVTHTAAAHRCRAEIDYQRGYPVMRNHPQETEFAREAARTVAGNCAEAPRIMGGEDFAYMLNARPGAYILVGNGDTAALHHPEYDFNDEAIPVGVSWWVELVGRRLPRREAGETGQAA